MKRCCGTFSELRGLVGERGFSIEEPGEGDPHFGTALVFRATDSSEAQLVMVRGPGPVSLEGRIGMRFCPWCGRRFATKRHE